jgi:hypothetical protein
MIYIPTFPCLYKNTSHHLECIFNGQNIVHDAINERPYVNKLHIIEVLRRMREYNQRSCVRKYHFSEVIQDVSIYRTLPQVFSLTLPRKKRSLYPARTHLLPVMSRTQSSSLLLTVIGGRNVPRKMEGMAAESSREEVLKANTDGRHVPNGSEDETCVGVVVKIRCRGKRYQTKLVDCGTSSPQWKETFCIPLCEEMEDVIPSDLLDDVVHISLFDCASVDLKHIGGFYEEEDSTHSELRYLVRFLHRQPIHATFYCTDCLMFAPHLCHPIGSCVVFAGRRTLQR